GLLLVHNLYKHRDRWLSYLLVPAVIVGPWLLFAYFYFGSIIPNSVAAKLALYSRFGAGSVWDRLVYLMSWHNPLGWIMFALAIPGLWWLHKKVLSGRLEAIWILMMLAFYVFSNTLLFFWYVAPLYPVYLLLVAASVPWAVERLRFNVIRERKLAPFVYALMVLVLLAGCYRPVMYYRDFQESMTHVHREVGLYLKTRAAENDLVAAEDIGLMGYLSGLRILDRDGLVSPEAIPYNRTGDYLGLIQDYRPDWVVATNSPISGFVTDSAFLAHYQQDTLYSRQDMTCRVFSRRP
ncbi:MAG: hypothetical protein KKA42_13150, partial [candidate division Zixibacteria bacterium]|nr:hypothetical protein [candidate division Zixibacteria bacterium]